MPIAIVEFITAAFIFILLVSQFSLQDRSLTTLRVRILHVLTIVWLTDDALAGLLIEADESLFVHALNLFAFMMSNIVIIGFMFYCEAYIREKTSLSGFVFGIPAVILGIDVILDIICYLRGMLVVYENGRYVLVGYPCYFVMYSYAVFMMYIPAVAFFKRKVLGRKAVGLLTSYCSPMIIAVVLIKYAGIPDVSAIAGSIASIFVAVLLKYDLTETHLEQANRTILEQKCQLERALEETQAANRSKTEFLFNMSHDVRTPMNAILGFTNIAIKNIDDRERVLDCLDKAKLSGNLLLTLINSVLDMSRIENGMADTDLQDADVCLSFSTIETTMREEASLKDIDISFEYGTITDRYVSADIVRCIRILTNLISNSIKYTPEGGKISVLCEQASPAEGGTAVYRYVVADNGIGMSAEFQDHMFEAFARERSTTVSGIQGTGLGLSVCKAFVDYLHGDIRCESTQGVGSVFTVCLPFKVRETADSGPFCDRTVEEAETFCIQPALLEGRRVLIAEDNDLNREIEKYLLEEKGIIVDEAEDGERAIEMYRSKEPGYYDLILMDIQMPVIDGYDATKIIRNIYPDSYVPIIAVSANAFEEDREASHNAGMDDHVAKPIEVNEFFRVISDHMQG